MISFLRGFSGHTPAIGQIAGMLKTTLDETNADRPDARAAGKSAVPDF